MRTPKRKTLTLVINTKNEEKNIAKCIKSVIKLVDEIIVVDMQSTDATVAIAKKLGAKIYSCKDYGYVEPARNIGIKKSNSDYILILDADEIVHTKLARTIKKIVQENQYDVIKIPIKTIIFGKWMKHSGWWPVSHIALFRKNHAVWNKYIHSQPFVKGTILELPFEERYCIEHNNFESIDHLLKKIFKYTLYESTKDKELLIASYKEEFNRRYITNKGYLDGNHGFFLSKFMEFYKFLELARYWEKQNYSEMFDSNNSFENTIDSIKNISMQNELSRIKKSKFYRIWRIYSKLKDKFSK